MDQGITQFMSRMSFPKVKRVGNLSGHKGRFRIPRHREQAGPNDDQTDQSYAPPRKSALNIRSCLTTVAVVACIALLPASGRAEKSGATGTIRKFNATLLEAMKKADELGYAGRYKLLEPVIRDSFALLFMAGQSAGSYWKTFKEEERGLFLKTYTEWTVSTYAGRFDGYSGERFDILSESEPDRGTVTVISRLAEPDHEGVEFHYKLRKTDGQWRIVDIQISGVSQLALTRSQFVAVIKNKGFNGLITMLKEKIAAFSQGKGE